MKSAFMVVALVGLPFAAGCARSNELQPRVVSSTSQAAYVEDYPAVFEAATKRASDDDVAVRALITAMPGYARDFKAIDAERAQALVSAADESGRSEGFVERARELGDVQAFLDEERDPLTRRVTGATAHALKEKSVDADVSGPVAYALKDGLDRGIDKRRRDRNEAHALLEKWRFSLPPQTVATLDKPTDAIAVASYTVYVALPQARERLQKLRDEQSAVASTIDRQLEEERAHQADKGRSEAEKRAAADRIAALSRGKATLERVAPDAKRIATDLEQHIPEQRKAYEDALKSLRDQIGRGS
jgi:hypothetical protein